MCGTKWFFKIIVSRNKILHNQWNISHRGPGSSLYRQFKFSNDPGD